MIIFGILTENHCYLDRAPQAPSVNICI